MSVRTAELSVTHAGREFVPYNNDWLTIYGYSSVCFFTNNNFLYLLSLLRSAAMCVCVLGNAPFMSVMVRPQF